MKTKFAKHAEAILENRIVSLGNFCGSPNSAGTLPTDMSAFQGIVNPDSLNISEAGIYCFWWIGSLEILNSGMRTVKIKGKKVGADEKRLHPELQLIEDDHILHTVTWQFDIQRNVGHVPLYVGNASNIFKRIHQHVQWPDTASTSYKRDGTVSRIEHAGTVNSQAQFRKPFEYLFQKKTEDERIQYLREYVGISFINTKLHDINNHFFWEDKLIGTLRPPFNLDSVR